MEQERFYILFPNHTEGMKLDTLLKDQKIRRTIVPTPRELSHCCGISIMYHKEDEISIRGIIEENNVKTLGFHSVKKEIKNFYLG